MGGRAGAVGRAAVLVGVLLGLLLMHGSPVSAGGCHEASTVTMAMDQAAPAADASMTVGSGIAPGPQLHVPAGHLAAATCTAVQTRDPRLLPAPALVLLLLPLALLAARPGRTAGPAAARHRGPPHGGRELLLQVCVART